MLLALAVVADVRAQRGPAPLSEEKAIRSADWHQRQSAFASLIGVDADEYRRGANPNVASLVRARLTPLATSAADRRKRLLIELVATENAMVNGKADLRFRLGLAELPPADRLSEEYLNYYGDVVAAVTALADVRSIDALAGAITTGEMVRGTLIAFGPPAVAAVASKTGAPDDQVRSAAVFTLGQMLARSKAIAGDPASRFLITDTLRASARDHSYLVRARAVEGLVQLGDADSIAIVKELASSDPYTYPAEYAERKGRYPVREAAAAVLKARGIR